MLDNLFWRTLETRAIHLCRTAVIWLDFCGGDVWGCFYRSDCAQASSQYEGSSLQSFHRVANNGEGSEFRGFYEILTAVFAKFGWSWGAKIRRQTGEVAACEQSEVIRRERWRQLAGKVAFGQ